MLVDVRWSRMSARERAKSGIQNVLRRCGISRSLRGSWRYDDFHLSKDGLQSLSDLDLVMDEAPEPVRRQYAEEIKNELRAVLALRVSIHRSDSLLKMNLGDSIVLNMGEFIAKTSRIDQKHPEYSYTLAKISLLMLRDSTQERYFDVSQRIRTREAERSIRVKLGDETDFSTEAALTLLSVSSKSTVKYFVKNCVQRSPSCETIMSVKAQIRQCRSIAPWLQNYLICKMCNGAS